MVIIIFELQYEMQLVLSRDDRVISKLLSESLILLPVFYESLPSGLDPETVTW